MQKNQTIQILCRRESVEIVRESMTANEIDYQAKKRQEYVRKKVRQHLANDTDPVLFVCWLFGM